MTDEPVSGLPMSDDDVADAIGPYTFENPRFVANAWWQAMYQRDNDAVRILITPESRWSSDFDREREQLELCAGVSDLLDYPSPQVCWVRLPIGVEPNAVHRHGDVRRGFILTLEHRPDLPVPGWRVHRLDDFYPQPQDIDTAGH